MTFLISMMILMTAPQVHGAEQVPFMKQIPGPEYDGYRAEIKRLSLDTLTMMERPKVRAVAFGSCSAKLMGQAFLLNIMDESPTCRHSLSKLKILDEEIATRKLAIKKQRDEEDQMKEKLLKEYITDDPRSVHATP